MGVIYNTVIKVGKACAPKWYKFTPRAADLEYEFVGEDISSGNNIQFRGSVIDHNGYHYSIPYAATSIVRTDTRNGSQTKYNVNKLSTSRQKWIDVVYASNKKIYASPHSAKGILRIDTEDPDNVVVDEVRYGYGLQCRGIALKDNGDGTGRGYLTTYSGSSVVRRFNFTQDKDTPVSHVNYTYPYELDPYYNYRNSVKLGSTTLAKDDCKTRAFMYRSFWGAVNGGNGLIYGIPYGSAFVMTIDTDNGDAVEFLTDYPLSANAAYSDKRWNENYLYGASPQWGKYRGGVLASNGCIYSFGTHARSVLKINTINNYVTEIPYPQEVIDRMVEGQSPALSASIGKGSTSFFSYEGPEGNVYNTLWNVDMQLCIDTQTDNITFKSLSDIINKETTGASSMRYTSASTIGNSTFMAPGVANQVLKITYPEANVPVSPTPTPSTSICIAPSVTPSTSMHICPSTTPTSTPTLTPTNCVQPSQTSLPTYTSCATCTPTSTPSISQSVTPTPSISCSITPTPSSTPSPTQSTSTTPSPTPSASGYTSPTPTPSVTPSISVVPTKPVNEKKESFWDMLIKLLKSLFS